MHKTWNVRDQPREELIAEITRKQKEILEELKLLREISIEAKKLAEDISAKKEFAKKIEIELLRREYNNGETQ